MIIGSNVSLIEKLITYWHNFTFARYFGASLIALIVDIIIYSIAITVSILPSLSAALGYSVGIIIHWLVSSNFVFIGKKRSGGKLQLQRAFFAGSALLGLSLTIGIVQIITMAGIGAFWAKIIAVLVSFIVVYAVRKWGVFR